MEYKFVKPLRDRSAIESFFAERGVVIPPGFMELFTRNNGGRPEENECVLKDGSERVVNNFLSFNAEDKENVYKAIKRVSEDNKKLIPFARDPAGNYFCLLDGRVVFWDHEDGEIVEAAGSFLEFCEILGSHH